MLQFVPEVEQAVIKRELVGDIALKIHGAVNGAADGEEQVMLFSEVNDGAEIEGGVVAAADLLGGLMVDFRADEGVG